MDTRGTSKPRAETGKPKQISISGGYREHFSKRISLTTTERIDFEGVNVMNKTLVFWPVAILIACTSAPYALRDMGSFHVGGRDVEITGKPVKEVVFTPGGVPAEGRSQRHVLGRGDVRAVFSAGGSPRVGAASHVARRGPDGRDVRDDARRARGMADFFVKQGWDCTTPTRWSAAARAGR